MEYIADTFWKETKQDPAFWEIKFDSKNNPKWTKITELPKEDKPIWQLSNKISYYHDIPVIVAPIRQEPMGYDEFCELLNKGIFTMNLYDRDNNKST